MKLRLLITTLLLAVLTACAVHPVIDTRDPANLAIVEARRTPVVECLNIKGNISAAGERIAHSPGQANYENVKIDKDGEEVFCTLEEAIAEGWRAALR